MSAVAMKTGKADLWAALLREREYAARAVTQDAWEAYCLSDELRGTYDPMLHTNDEGPKLRAYCDAIQAQDAAYHKRRNYILQARHTRSGAEDYDHEGADFE